MGFSLKDFLGNSAAKVVEAIGTALDKNITNREERDAAKLELTKVFLESQRDSEIELTKRLQADMSSDSWLSKNIRPLTLIFLLVVTAVLTLFDGNVGGFTVNMAYIELYKSLLLVAFCFYYGSRGAEKIMQQIHKSKQDKP